MSETANRRQGFRMDDTLKLRVSVPDSEQADGILCNFEEYRLSTCLPSHLHNQTVNRMPALQGIRKRHPEIADYLQHLEMQISDLAAQVSREKLRAVDKTHTNTQAVLSASGLEFPWAEKFEVGQILELDIMLSSGTHLVAVAEVKRVDSIEPDPHQTDKSDHSMSQLSTCFLQIHPDDIEGIIRHLAKLQQRQLQARREQH